MLVNKICDHLSLRIENEELSNDDMIKIIEHIGRYLNIQTISDYARENKMSYNGVKKFRTVKKVFNVNFVVDNF